MPRKVWIKRCRVKGCGVMLLPTSKWSACPGCRAKEQERRSRMLARCERTGTCYRCGDKKDPEALKRGSAACTNCKAKGRR